MFCLSSSSLLIFSSSSVFMASNSNVRSLWKREVRGGYTLVRLFRYQSGWWNDLHCAFITSRCCLAPCISHSCLCLITCRHSSLYTPAETRQALDSWKCWKRFFIIDHVFVWLALISGYREVPPLKKHLGENWVNNAHPLLPFSSVPPVQHRRTTHSTRMNEAL